MKKYDFRREDTGQIIKVAFEQMMEQDCAGYVVVETPEGQVRARRVNRSFPAVKGVILDRVGEKPIVSDALGFIEAQLPEFEADRRAHGFSDIEFIRDPDVPGFIQVAPATRGAWNRYMKHRGMMDISGKERSCGALSRESMEQAKVAVLKQYPNRKVG